MSESPPESAANKPPSGAPAEPIGAEVSRAVPKPGETVRIVAPPSGPTEPPPPDGLALPPFIVGLQAAVPDAVEHVSWWVGDWSLVVGRPASSRRPLTCALPRARPSTCART